MDLEEVACRLSDLLQTNRAVFLRTEPEALDHTAGTPFKCVIGGTDQQIEFEVGPKDMMSLVGQFDHTLFDKDRVDRLYVWNFKSFATYFHAFNPDKFVQPAKEQVFIDLKPIENFLGIRKNRPENLLEAVNRTKLALQHKGWQSVYKAVHLPLSLRVLPSIETTPLLNEEAKRPEFPFYEIEGQTNGRMNCYNKFAKCYLPHNMGPNVRRALKPKGYKMRFLCADYRHCEVTVLQWLSKDEKLRELLDSGQDLHAAIYQTITGDNCDSEAKRDMSKLIFLPVMYGCGAATLAKRLAVSEPVAKELIHRLKASFPTAWAWMYQRQELAKAGPVLDFFGRPRSFPEDQTYLARNFSVQGVAATVCQEKLIELYKSLDGIDAYIVFSVHDGYGLACTVSAAQATYRKVKDILEAESQLCPGLKMKAKLTFGVKLDAMKELWRN